MNEGYGSGPLIQLNYVIVHTLRQVLLSFRDRIAESVFVIPMNVNSTADFFPDAESFRSVGEFSCQGNYRSRGFEFAIPVPGNVSRIRPDRLIVR